MFSRHHPINAKGASHDFDLGALRSVHARQGPEVDAHETAHWDNYDMSRQSRWHAESRLGGRKLETGLSPTLTSLREYSNDHTVEYTMRAEWLFSSGRYGFPLHRRY